MNLAANIWYNGGKLSLYTASGLLFHGQASLKTQEGKHLNRLAKIMAVKRRNTIDGNFHTNLTPVATLKYYHMAAHTQQI